MVHMPSLNLTSISFLLYLGFVCSPSTVTAQKANVYSPWNSCLAFITPRLIIILNAFFSSDIGSATQAHWKRDKTLCFKWKWQEIIEVSQTFEKWPAPSFIFKKSEWRVRSTQVVGNIVKRRVAKTSLSQVFKTFSKYYSVKIKECIQNLLECLSNLWKCLPN